MDTEHIALKSAVEAVISCFEHGGKLLVCGNGGSAADSAHIVGELVKGFLKRRPVPSAWTDKLGETKLQMGLPAIDLTAQGAVISAIANDLGGEYIFAQQVSAYGTKGDILFGISTSGNAENVCLAMKVAALKGMTCIGMTGSGGGRMAELSDILLAVTESETYKVQERHIVLYHMLCAEVEAHFFSE